MDMRQRAVRMCLCRLFFWEPNSGLLLFYEGGLNLGYKYASFCVAVYHQPDTSLNLYRVMV